MHGGATAFHVSSDGYGDFSRHRPGFGRGFPKRLPGFTSDDRSEFLTRCFHQLRKAFNDLDTVDDGRVAPLACGSAGGGYGSIDI